MLLLCFAFPVLSFRSWSYPVYYVVLFWIVCHIFSGGARHLFFLSYCTLLVFSCFFVSFVFLSVNASGFLAFARLRVIVVLGRVTSSTFSVHLPGWTCTACARNDWGRRIVCGNTRQYCVPVLWHKIIANKTTTQTNSSQSNSTRSTQRNISSPAFAKLISVFYFQYEIITFFDKHYFSLACNPVSRWHIYMLAC